MTEVWVRDESGEVLYGPDLEECSECGSLVGDQRKHANWHAKIKDDELIPLPRWVAERLLELTDDGLSWDEKGEGGPQHLTRLALGIMP